MAKLTVADLVPEKRVFVAKGTRNGEAFECELEFKPLDNAADLFDCYGLLGQDNGIYEVMARLTGLTSGQCAYVFLACDNRDQMVQVVGQILGSEGEVDPTTEGSSA